MNYLEKLIKYDKELVNESSKLKSIYESLVGEGCCDDGKKEFVREGDKENPEDGVLHASDIFAEEECSETDQEKKMTPPEEFQKKVIPSDTPEQDTDTPEGNASDGENDQKIDAAEFFKIDDVENDGKKNEETVSESQSYTAMDFSEDILGSGDSETEGSEKGSTEETPDEEEPAEEEPAEEEPAEEEPAEEEPAEEEPAKEEPAEKKPDDSGDESGNEDAPVEKTPEKEPSEEPEEGDASAEDKPVEEPVKEPEAEPEGGDETSDEQPAEEPEPPVETSDEQPAGDEDVKNESETGKVKYNTVADFLAKFNGNISEGEAEKEPSDEEKPDEEKPEEEPPAEVKSKKDLEKGATPDVDPEAEPQKEVPMNEEMTEEKYLKESIDAIRAYVKANKELFYDRY